MKTKIRLKNLDCAACAAELERVLAKIEGVNEVAVDFVRQSILLDCTGDAAYRAVVDAANSFEDVRVVEKQAGGGVWQEHRADIVAVVAAAVCLVAGIQIGRAHV